MGAPPEEKRKAKLEHARSMLHRSKTRLRRATTIEKKWRQRVAKLEKPRAIPFGAPVSREKAPAKHGCLWCGETFEGPGIGGCCSHACIEAHADAEEGQP